MVAVRLMHIFKNIFDLVSRAVSFIILLFCIITTPIAYFKVFKIIRRHQQQVTANDSSQNFGQPAINFAKYKKSVFTILYILVLLFVSTLPLLVFVGLSLFKHSSTNRESVFLISMLFLFQSSSLNLLIYLWRMNDIRHEVRHLLNQILC